MSSNPSPPLRFSLLFELEENEAEDTAENVQGPFLYVNNACHARKGCPWKNGQQSNEGSSKTTLNLFKSAGSSTKKGWTALLMRLTFSYKFLSFAKEVGLTLMFSTNIKSLINKDMKKHFSRFVKVVASFSLHPALKATCTHLIFILLFIGRKLIYYVNRLIECTGAIACHNFGKMEEAHIAIRSFCFVREP